MAVTYDAVASNSGYPPNDISVSHSLGSASGNNRIVLVGVLTVGGTSETVTSVTYNSVAMTLLTQVSQTYFGRESWMRVYYMLDSSLPSSSGSYTVTADFPGGSGAYYGIVSAISYTGVSQSAPPYASGSNQGTPLSGQYSTNITLASSTGMIVDFGGIEMSGYGSTAQSPGTSQTERLDTLYVEICQAISEKAFTSSGSNSMAQTPNSNYAFYGHILAELAESGGAPPTGISYLGSQGYTTASGTSVSGSYTCHSGTNRKLLVAAGGEYIGAGMNVNSVTYNGTSLTKIAEYDHSTPYNCVAWFYLDDASFPATPGSYTLQANFSQTANPGHMMVIEIEGAKQGAVDAYNSSEGSTVNTLNTTVSTSADDSWIFGAAITGDTNTFTPQSGQNERVDQSGGGGGCSGCLGDEEIASAGSTNMQWGTSSTVNRIIQMVLAVAPVSEAQNAVMLGMNF